MKEKSELEILREQEANLQAQLEFDSQNLAELKKQGDNPEMEKAAENNMASHKIALVDVQEKIKAIEEMTIERAENNEPEKKDIIERLAPKESVANMLRAARIFLELQHPSTDLPNLQEQSHLERPAYESEYKGEVVQNPSIHNISVSEHDLNERNDGVLEEVIEGVKEGLELAIENLEKPECDAAEKWRNDIKEKDKQLLADYKHDINELKSSKDMMELNLSLSDAKTIPDPLMRDEKMIMAENAIRDMMSEGLEKAEAKLDKGLELRESEVEAYQKAVEQCIEAGPNVNEQNQAIEDSRMEFEREMAKQREREIEDIDSPRR